jgi:hypothetical protein
MHERRCFSHLIFLCEGDHGTADINHHTYTYMHMQSNMVSKSTRRNDGHRTLHVGVIEFAHRCPSVEVTTLTGQHCRVAHVPFLDTVHSRIATGDEYSAISGNSRYQLKTGAWPNMIRTSTRRRISPRGT